MLNILKLPAAIALMSALINPACAAPMENGGGNWVTTWLASPQPTWGADFVLPTNVPRSLRRQTVRETVRISAGGEHIRVVYSNRYGVQPLTIGEVRIALSADGPAIVKGSERIATFGNERSVTVPPGASAVSDAVKLAVAPLERLAVTTYFPKHTPLTTFHWGEQQTGYIASGNVTDAIELKQASRLKGRAFLTSVLADATPGARTAVIFGDSITDGNGSTPDLNRRWPDYLAERLAHLGVAIANAGISGARVLGDRMGVNAVARFEQDVLSQPAVETVVVAMGINDIGWPGSPFAPKDQAMTATKLIAGYRQLISAARAHNVRIVGATMTPFEGALQGTPFAGHYSPGKDAVRRAVNQWIRNSRAFDAILDFDALMRDPQHPSRLLPAFDSGDHLHPGDAGYKAMADAVDLRTLFGDEHERQSKPGLADRRSRHALSHQGIQALTSNSSSDNQEHHAF